MNMISLNLIASFYQISNDTVNLKMSWLGTNLAVLEGSISQIEF